MRWTNLIIKVGPLLVTIIASIFYFGGNFANIKTSISDNSKNVIEIKKGNDKIISLLEKVKDKQHSNEIKIVKNAGKINTNESKVDSLIDKK